MSHMVIHTTADGVTQYRQFDDLGSAVPFVEDQRNAGIESVRLFEMREIALEVKSYFKVEIADAPVAAVPTPAPAPEPAVAPVVEVPVADAPSAMDTAESLAASELDDISYVEAAMASPLDAFASEVPKFGDPHDDLAPPTATESRRGLFGR